MLVNMYRPVSRQAVNGRAINSLFDTVLTDFFSSSAESATKEAAPTPVTLARFDVIEKADRFEAFVELPGVVKEDIEIQVDGAKVSVKAQTKAAEALQEGERVLYAGRLTRRFDRAFELPSDVEDAQAEASFENGVLKLVLPKKAVPQPKRLAIK
jgi:HSP20 family protein